MSAVTEVRSPRALPALAPKLNLALTLKVSCMQQAALRAPQLKVSTCTCSTARVLAEAALTRGSGRTMRVTFSRKKRRRSARRGARAVLRLGASSLSFIYLFNLCLFVCLSFGVPGSMTQRGLLERPAPVLLKLENTPPPLPPFSTSSACAAHQR